MCTMISLARACADKWSWTLSPRNWTSAYAALKMNYGGAGDRFPRARRSVDSFHFNTEIEKPTHWFNFWTSVILSVRPNDDNHYTFSIFTHFSAGKKNRLADTAEEAEMQLKFDPMVDPWIKWRKSKDRARKPSKKRPYQFVGRCWENDFSRCCL